MFVSPWLVAVLLSSNPVGANDVVWTAPSRDESGSMPIGNGDLAANVWVDAGGTLSLYLAKSDAWDDNARLLKLGRLRINVEPNPLEDGGPFRQRLDVHDGEIEIELGKESNRVALTVRVDANRPVLVVDCASAQPTTIDVQLDHWRLAPRTVKELTWSDVTFVGWGQPPRMPIVTEADRVVPATQSDRGSYFAWYHRNERSPIPLTFELQGLNALLPSFRDPILHRSFGALVTGSDLVPLGDRGLRSTAPSRDHHLEAWALTRTTETPDEFVAALKLVAGTSDESIDASIAHREWWHAFWNRSWIRLADNGTTPAFPLAANDLPVMIGADEHGENALHGSIESVLVLGRASTEDEIAALAANPGASPADTILRWRAGEPRSIPDSPALDARGGITVAAWIVPEREDPGGGRIVDKCPVGSGQGWMLDTYPGNSLRFIAGGPALTMDARLAPGRRTFVAATYDPRTAQRRLFIDGKKVAESAAAQSPVANIERAYVLQRYMSAAAGRGAAPIKFNGSLFTVGRAGFDDGDPDFRRWGPAYWFQNTRLIYWPMFASGDFDLTDPFFRMYRDALPLVEASYALHHGSKLPSGAAAFYETIYFWGTPDNPSFGWDRTNAQPGEVVNPYIRHYRSGSLELLVMALERYEYTRDEEFFRDTVLPFAQAFLGFYSSFFPRNADGTIRFEPAASLETWHEATDPLPEIAGLRDAIDRLLRVSPALLALAPPDFVANAQRLRASLPPIPLGGADDARVLLPAARFAALSNVENPELYAVFPYRIFGVGKPDIDIAQRTFDARQNRANAGWCQDSIHAAHLGRADEAAAMLTQRVAMKDQKSRFPVFWGPNYDWVPDQDHGSTILMTLQTMLLQCDGDRMLLLPAWPSGWDCDFRLHAPKNTVLEGSVRQGRVVSLQVDPPERVKDVEFLGP
ncbi:MAG: DUF5703 domain-containing protein [Phycisphaerales bacterium]